MEHALVDRVLSEISDDDLETLAASFALYVKEVVAARGPGGNVGNKAWMRPQQIENIVAAFSEMAIDHTAMVVNGASHIDFEARFGERVLADGPDVPVFKTTITVPEPATPDVKGAAAALLMAYRSHTPSGTIVNRMAQVFAAEPLIIH